MLERGACPAIGADLYYFRMILTHCWASANPFRAIPGSPDVRGVRHTPVEAQCYMLSETDIGLCTKHYKEIVHEGM